MRVWVTKLFIDTLSQAMKLTTRLLQKRHDPSFLDNGCDNIVLRFQDPTVVSDIYKEHVWGWVHASSLSPVDMATWTAGTEWLRSLEGVEEPRLFNTVEFLGKDWWETQCAVLVSRRPTSRRLRLPLGKEIDVCVECLMPHAVLWLLDLVGEKSLELAMHPKSLLQHVFRSLRKASAREMKTLLARCRVLYPKVKCTYTADDVKKAALHVHLSHWPGLRLCPPFFPDLISLQQSPSVMVARSGKHVVLHAASRSSYATTSILDATTCSLETMVISSGPESPLFLGVHGDSAEPILDALGRLHGMHPRSFPPIHPDSPFVAAAKVFSMEGGESSAAAVKLPERPLDNGDTGFSFTYMPPRVLDETCVAWQSDEYFNQVEMTYEGTDHNFYVSPYVGWGFRLRHMLLTVVPQDKLGGRGVCVVVPENVDQMTVENILLTSLGWLSDLKLSNVTLVSEGTCQRVGLQSLVMEHAASFASIHDGHFVFHALDSIGFDTATTHANSILGVLMDKMRRHFLDTPPILAAIHGLTVDRFKGRTRMIERVACQLLDCTRVLDLASTENLDKATCTFELETNAPPVQIEVSIPVFEEWVRSSFEGVVGEKWWPRFTERLEKCRRILLSGGVFDCCPHSSMKAWNASVGPSAKESSEIQKSFLMEAACLNIHSTNGQREMIVSEGRKPVPPSQ